MNGYSRPTSFRLDFSLWGVGGSQLNYNIETVFFLSLSFSAMYNAKKIPFGEHNQVSTNGTIEPRWCCYYSNPTTVLFLLVSLGCWDTAFNGNLVRAKRHRVLHGIKTHHVSRKYFSRLGINLVTEYLRTHEFILLGFRLPRISS